MSDKINKALHGVIQPGKCFHEWKEKFRESDGYQHEQCINCPVTRPLGHRGKPYSNPDYFSRDGFWDALKYAMKQKWWFKFNGEFFLPAYIKVELVNYKTFAKHLYDFLVTEGIVK